MMEQCSICLESLDDGVVALAACGHRFHAACLAQMAGAVGTATTRRGSLTACPNCRTVSRVAPVTTPVAAAFCVGDKVLALCGTKYFPGVVDAVLDGDRYAIAFDDGDRSDVAVSRCRPQAPVRPAPVRSAVAAPAPEEEPAAPSTAAPTPQQPRMRIKTSRFKGVRHQKNSNGDYWIARIRVDYFEIPLGTFDDEEDAARSYDAALVKYKGAPTVNFPGEAPLASVLAALPELDYAAQHRPTTSSEYDAIVAAAASDTAAPRQERSSAGRRVIPEAPAIRLHRGPKPVEMRRVGDRAWRCFESQRDAARAFGVDQSEVSKLVRNLTCNSLRGSFEARSAQGPPKKRERPTKRKAHSAPLKYVEGAYQKQNGKWGNLQFPGREFESLDEFRAAKKQRAERRKEYSTQNGLR